MKKIIFLWLILNFSFFTQANNQEANNQEALQKAFNAVLNGKTEVISTYLTIGLVDVHATDNHGNTLLHSAVMMENPLIVRILLEYKADPHKKNNFGVTPLSLSKELENTQITNMLTQGTEQKSDSKSNSGQKKRQLPSLQEIQEEEQLREAFWQAVKKGTSQKVSTLLSIGADKYVDEIRKLSSYSELVTPLLIAIDRRAIAGNNRTRILATSESNEYEQQEAESKIIKEIKEADKIIDNIIRYANVNLQAEAANLTLPINLAILFNLPEVVEKLIQAGANVVSPQNFIFHPLTKAMDRFYFEIIEILLKYKAPFSKEMNDHFKKKGKGYRKVLLFVYQHTGNPDNAQAASEEQYRPPNNSEDKTSSSEAPRPRPRPDNTENKVSSEEPRLRPRPRPHPDNTKDKTLSAEEQYRPQNHADFKSRCRRVFQFFRP